MKKILLIEDDKMLNDDLGLLLSLSGYKVLSSNDGKRGIEIALKENPNLILCDIQMPNLDGYDVIHILSNNPKTSDIPFIFITGDSEPESQRRGMGLGADDYLIKPINTTDLLNAISVRLAKNENLKRKFQASKEIEPEKNSMRMNAVPLICDEHERQHFGKKHVLYAAGQRPTFLYYVQKGKVKEFLINEEGKELITGIYSEGDFFGYTEILRGCNYCKNAKIIEDAVLCLVPKQEFVQKTHTNPAIVTYFMNLLSQNITENEDILINMAYNS
ncbi:response regulator, partial [Pseudoxanthomonas sp. SGD-10]